VIRGDLASVPVHSRAPAWRTVLAQIPDLARRRAAVKLAAERVPDEQESRRPIVDRSPILQI
jgi:hypothetical protein